LLDAWIAETSPYTSYSRFARSGMEIPFFGQDLKRMKDAANDPDDFGSWLDGYIGAKEAVAEFG
jgi:hypothetical protein